MAEPVRPGASSAQGSRWPLLLSGRDALGLLPEIVVTLALISLIWTSVYLGVRNAYELADHRAVQETANLSTAFADGATRVVLGIDQTLLSVRAAYASDPEHFDLDEWNRKLNRPDVLNVHLGLIGPDGVAVGSTMKRAAASIDLSDREHFRAQLDPSHDDLFISRPLLGRGTGVWTVQFTRKLLDAAGRLAGVMVYSLSCEELSRSYERVDVGNGFVMLAGLDGVVRARAPLEPTAVGRDLQNAPFFAQVAAEASGSYQASNAASHAAWTVSFRRLANYPLVMMVGFSQERVLSEFFGVRERAFLFGTLMTVAVLMLAVLWIMQRRRSAVSSRALQATLDHMSQGVALIDGRGRVPVLNKRAAELLDLPAPMLGRMSSGLGGLLRAIGAGDSPDGKVLQRGDRLVEVEASVLPRGGSLLTYTDVTEQRRDEARIRHLALHDGLTGLANRLMLNDRITEAAAEGRRFAVLALDLDGFKAVNDGLGHDVGDAVLVRASARIQAAAGVDDVVARVGGDEFTVLLRHAGTPGEAERLAAVLVGSLAEPIVVDSHVCLIGASVGVVLAPDDGTDAGDLLKKADMALYRAKCDGRGRFCRFDGSMFREAAERHWLERELRMGVERDQIEVFFQPQFACSTGHITGFEALARWRHPDRGLIPPDVFIPLAEESGMIIDIGRIVLQKACSSAAGWPHPYRVCVNLSPIQFRDAALPEFLTSLTASTGLPLHLLELEVTEGVLIGDERQALRILQTLHDLGVGLALDDFGTGYSSLSYLQRFNFDRVKIDKSFVQAQQTDKRARAILNAVLALSHSLDLVVIAEGVETAAQYVSLREQGCGEVQGFLLGRPMPAGEVEEFIRTTSAKLLAGTDLRIAAVPFAR